MKQITITQKLEIIEKRDDGARCTSKLLKIWVYSTQDKGLSESRNTKKQATSELFAEDKTHEAAVGATPELVAGSEAHEAGVSATRELVFVAGRKTREVAAGATRELIVTESETHEAAVGGMCELVVAGGGTHEAAVGEWCAGSGYWVWSYCAV